MTDVTFADLIEIYRATRFDDETGDVLTIKSEHMVAVLTAIMEIDAYYHDAQISVENGDELVVGSDVPVTIGRPNVAKMGLLVPTFDDLFKAPGAVLAEPERYYIKKEHYASGDSPVPPKLLAYRAVLNVLTTLRESASLVDETMRQLIFIGKEKVVVPIQFGSADLRGDVVGQANRLAKLFADELHLDEKRTILQTTLIEMVRSLREKDRFGFLIRNLDRLANEVEKGYRLFTSSFSYSKIRNEVETARLDFVGKIHKTIVDIQGQLLGIPVATIVVVSQLKKVPPSCGLEFWTNLGVLTGAIVFAVMLGIAGLNQWKTLNVIATEVKRQSNRLSDDFALIADQFSDVFDDLHARIRWHRAALLVVGGVLSLGVIITAIAVWRLLPDNPWQCF
ncbi:hypothetical protein K3M67_14010 [Sphingobium sp. V4]|uniref:hypothetical protein n=1 Tax=Sphingobium sp. V4 TaxID=3038927 RepID=UPI0025583253|nr:hypothetical protein [Sphingobium sp. V4]WIW88058.1 hypothetical protein K3M67_14010 [Sphingobium sp. V4]